MEARQQHQGRGEHEQPQRQHRHRPDDQRLLRERRGHQQGDAAPDELLGVLHRDPGADHHQHHGVGIGGAERAQQHEFDERAQRKAEQRRQRDGGEEIQLKHGDEQIGQVGAEGVELAVGEIDHPHDPEDQREADAEQRVGAAQHERVQEVLEKFVHKKTPGVASWGFL